MKHPSIFITILLISILALNNRSYGQTYSLNSEMNKFNSSFSNNLEIIKISRWKNGAKTCVNFSFDDNNKFHKKISEIFDQYGFRAVFFINSNILNFDSIKYISAKGHEIGNHTYSHQNLTVLDSLHIDSEIRESREMLENAIGIKCVSFADPYHQYNSLSKKIVYQYELFSRDYSEYSDINHNLLLSSPETNAKFMTYLKNALTNGSILEVCGHSIDGEGTEPISSKMLTQTLDSVNHYVVTGDVWVTTIKEGEQYENLYHEIELEKLLNGDTLTFYFKNYNRDKYQDLDGSPISLEIPSYFCSDLKCLTDFAEVKKMTDKFVITTDLMRDTSLVVVLNGFTGLLTDSLKIESPLIIYPNPSMDVLNLRCLNDISMVEIYDLKGKRLLSIGYNVTKIDISKLKSGFYLIKVVERKDSFSTIYKTKFLKI